MTADDTASADDERADQLSDGTDFSVSEAKRIVAFSKTATDDRDPDMLRPSGVEQGDEIDGLTPADCADIRRAMKAADSASEVVDAFPSKHTSVVFRHAQGRCGHDDVGVGPTTSPRIQKNECRAMRRDFIVDEVTVEDLKREYNRSTNAVTRHVFAECDHPRRVSPATCDAIRQRYRESDSVTVAQVAEEFVISEGSAHRHLTGGCAHRDDTDPVPADGNDVVTEAECDRMRERYHDVGSVRAIDASGDFDRHYKTIAKHVFGRCFHDGAVDPAGSTGNRVSADDCADMRYGYTKKPDVDVEELIERHDVGKGTFYYHVMGRCDHGSDLEDPAVGTRSSDTKH